MKRDTLRTVPLGLLLGTLLGVGSVWCLVTAFSLKVDFSQILTLCLLAGAVGGLCLSIPKGGYLLLCLMAALGGYLWHAGEIQKQTEVLLYTISTFYDSAYGTGVIYWSKTIPQVGISLPLGLLAGLIMLCVLRTVCRGKRLWLPLLLTVIPIAACFVVTDTVPAVPPLLCVVIGAALLLMGQAVRRRNPGEGARLTALLLLPVAMAAGILFVAVPQSTYHGQETAQAIQQTLMIWGQTADNYFQSYIQEEPQHVETPEVKLKELGPRRDLSVPVMQVTSPVSGPLYLRAQDYDQYTGIGWAATSSRREATPWPDPDTWLSSAGDVTVRTFGPWDHLVLPYFPTEQVPLSGGSIPNTLKQATYATPVGTLNSDWERADIEAMSTISGESLYLQHVDPPTTQREMLTYMGLPFSTRLWGEEVVRQLEANQTLGNYKAAQKIADYVRGSAEYNLNTGKMPADGDDFAQWFLEESDTGYCVHFATATTVLLRAAGIPARYVEGYLVDAQAGETVTVTQADAHAWVEYYIPNLGWVPLESTPGDSLSDLTSNPQPFLPSQTSDDTQPATEHSTPSQPTHATEPTTAKPTEPGDEPPEKPLDLRWLWISLTVLGCAVGLTAMVLGQWKLRRYLRTRKCPDPNTQALRQWQEVRRTARCLRREPPEELEALALRAKFSQHTLTDDELAAFQDWLQSARETLMRKPWYVRFWHRIVLAVY